MWPRFGIKLGNSTLCIAYLRTDGKVEVIANKQGDRTSQACLLWDGKTNEIECGLTARQKMALRPKQAVANSFQLLPTQTELTSEQLELALKHIPCEYNVKNHKYQEPGEKTEIEHEMSAYEVHVQLLRGELELARQYHNNKEQKPIVVLSIPSYYSEEARPLLAQVAEEAGFHVAQIIPEPTAALLAYNIVEPKDDRKYILTIKSGGIFSHFALYEMENDLFTLHQAYGPFTIGGENYTDALVSFICEEFQRKYKLNPEESRRSMAKIRNSAANCKHVLTTMPSTQIYIDSLMDGLDLNVQISRARFESLIQPVIANFMQTLQECVKHATSSIDSIVLLGATMQIPKLKATIASQYPEAQLHDSVPSDEVVAVGCAREATYLSNPVGQQMDVREQLNFAAAEVLIWHGEDESKAQVLVNKGAIIPHRVQLNVPLCEKTERRELFQVRAGKNTEQVCVPNAQPNKSKMFCIEAEITYAKDDAELPLIRLRCMG